MRSRRSWFAAGALVLVVASAGVVATNRPSTDPLPAPPTTSTSTTTLPPIVVDPNVTEVATATIPTVAVYAELPADATPDPRATQAGATLASMLPTYSPDRPGAPAIPEIESPVIGRRATATGWEFDHPTPWNGPLTFAVTENHGEWLRVIMPVRPNGTQGWIRAADVSLSTVQTRVEIDLSDRTLVARSGSEVIAQTGVVIGASDSPTPEGRFYVTDFEEKYRGSAYGPWILPVSGYSQLMDEFSGGVPVIALHGTNRPELIGTAASNGCVRMPDDVIEALRNRLPVGTPVDIRA